jgi:hypothetical protein
MTSGSAVRGSAYNGTVDVNVVGTTVFDVLVKVVVNTDPSLEVPVNVVVNVVGIDVKVVIVVGTPDDVVWSA